MADEVVKQMADKYISAAVKAGKAGSLSVDDVRAIYSDGFLAGIDAAGVAGHDAIEQLENETAIAMDLG